MTELEMEGFALELTNLLERRLLRPATVKSLKNGY